MARTSVTTVASTLAGAVATPTAPVADGDIVDAGRARLLVIAGATPTTVSIPTPATVNGLAVADAGGTVAANTARWFGPFPARLFAQPADAVVGAGRVLVDYSSVATVTRSVLA
jgi:hypothetical protein